MQISSSDEAGALVKSLRERRGMSHKELSEISCIPLRTVQAIDNGELNNLSIDRLIALLTALGATSRSALRTPAPPRTKRRIAWPGRPH